MGQLKLLDCTLRDGGYINDWMFGKDNIRTIIRGLFAAGIDIIECGYLSQKRPFNEDSTQISDFKYANSMLAGCQDGSNFVGMINYGEFSLEDIPSREDRGLSGLRIAFHKKDRLEALDFCKALKEKGYDIYLQPMVALSYTDEEFLDLIRRANEMHPHTFYIVDSFGAMKADDVLHLFYMIDYNLTPGIQLGFHSHNNLQLSYSHAQMLSNQQTDRTMIIDCSIMGIGRGAGNLNTELFSEYVNRKTGSNYQISSLLEIMDHVITPIYQDKYWGYSLPHYLSATHNCHPNYATYLDDKNTLTYKNIHEIFSMMSPEKKGTFDKAYIQTLYMEYQSKNRPGSADTAAVKQHLSGKKVLVLAPGRSVLDEQERIEAFIEKERPVIISVNFVPDNISADYVFISNLRRWEELRECRRPRAILTSNLDLEGTDTTDCFIADYKSLLNQQDKVKDNAGMMLLAFLIQMKAGKIYLAGMDGYAVDAEPNFVRANMEFHKKPAVMTAMNAGMSAVIAQYQKEIEIEFVTTPRYVKPALME